MIDQPKPKSKTTSVLKRGTFLFLELFFILLILVLAVGGALMWKLSQGKINVDFVKAHLEQAINTEIAPFYVESKNIGLKWENIFERPVFTIRDLSFYDPNQNPVLSVDGIGFTLSRSELFMGSVAPRYIEVTGLDLHLVRTEDEKLQLGFLSGPAFELGGDVDTNNFVDISLRQFYATQLQPVLDKSFFRGLKAFNLRGSFLVFEDLVSGQAISFPDLSTQLSSLGSSLEININVGFPKALQQGEESYILMQGRYNTHKSELSAYIEMKHFNPFLWAAILDTEDLNAEASEIFLGGEGQMVLDDHLTLETASFAVKAEKGEIDLPKLYDNPFLADYAVLNATYNRKNKEFLITESMLNAYGLKFGFQGRVPLPREGQNEYLYPFNIVATPFSFPLPELAYPDALEHENAYEWLTQKLAAGKVSDFSMDITLKAFKDELGEWDGDLESLDATYSFEEAKVVYNDKLMPLTNARGQAKIVSETDQLIVTGTGNFEDLGLTDVSVTYDRLVAKEPGYATIKFKSNGPLKTVIRYIEPEPIGVGKQISFNIDEVKGQSSLDVMVGLPSKKDPQLDEIEIDISGVIQDGFIPKLVNGLDISGGPMNLTLKNNLVQVEGNGMLDSRPAKFKWQQFLKSEGQKYKMQVDASLKADENLRWKFGIDLSDFAAGPADIDIVYTKYQDERADVNVKADLTNAQLYFDPLNYTKPAGAKSSATLKAFLKADQIRDIKALNIDGPELKIRKGNLKFKKGDIFSGTFASSTIGNTTVSGNFEYPTPKQLKLKVTGPVVDAGPFLQGPSEEKYEGPAVEASVSADKMLTKDGNSIRQAKIYVDMDRNQDMRQFEMDGVTGNGDIYIRYKPDQSGRPSLRAEISDAGAALKAFGVYNSVEGGRLLVTGVPSDEFWKGNLSGKAIMTNFTVVDAPALARLISALSLPGLAQLFSSEGIGFSRMEADFDWISRPGGSIINISDGRTSGSELGLTFAGSIDRATDTLDLSGTIVPASTVNNIIGKIPLIGDILTGGSGALIAATYVMRGPSQTAEVSINPLSVLTPGILRRIFFENEN